MDHRMMQGGRTGFGSSTPENYQEQLQRQRETPITWDQCVSNG
jgi:hypothetical protein